MLAGFSVEALQRALMRERQWEELEQKEGHKRMRERFLAKRELKHMAWEDKGWLLKEFACVGFPGSQYSIEQCAMLRRGCPVLTYIPLPIRRFSAPADSSDRLAYVTHGGTQILEAILTGCPGRNLPRPKRAVCLFTRPESDQGVALNRCLADISQQNRGTLFCIFDATKVCNKILADAAGNVQIPTLWLVKDGKVTRRMRGLAELGGDQSSWKTVATELQIHGLIKGSVLGSGLYTTTSDLYFLLLRLSQPPLRSDFNRVAGWGGKILRHIVEFIGPAWRGARSYQGGRRRRR